MQNRTRNIFIAHKSKLLPTFLLESTHEMTDELAGHNDDFQYKKTNRFSIRNDEKN